MVESITVDYRNDPQVVSGDQPSNLTSEQFDKEGFDSFLSTWEKQSRTNVDDGSFEIPKGAEKVELGEDELERTFDAIIKAYPEILESNEPTAELLQLPEVQELAWNDQRGFAGYVIDRRCSRMKKKEKE